MASLIRKLGSPFWYLSFRSGRRWLKKSLGLRADDPNETQEAEIARAQAEVAELKGAAVKTAGQDQRAWVHWVDRFLVRHCTSKQTLERYRGHWKFIHLWLQTRGLHTPAQVTYASIVDYMEWRTATPKRTGKKVGWNTARNDLKVLALAMGEAVRLGMVTVNPLARLGLKKEAAVRKPKLDDDAIERLEAALHDEPEWMRTAFRIALHTGCRLRETVIPLACVDLEAGGGVGKITFAKPKGGETRAFSRPVPTALRPMFAAMKKTGSRVTLELPFQPSRRWGQFLQVHGLPKEWVFHCLRVTYINRLRLARVPREDARRLVNHASEAVHQEYQREEFEDLLPYADAVRFPTSDAGRESSRPTSPEPETPESHPPGTARVPRRRKSRSAPQIP